MKEKELIPGVENTSLAAEITDGVRKQLPQEKALMAHQMRQTGREIQSGLTPTAGDGRGQPALSVPPLVYMRWHQEFPGCWSDKSFIEEFASDNPQCRFPGFRPKPKRMFFDMKHGNVKINRVGGDFYLANKARVNRELAAS